jgi:hypothetical protein
MFKIAIGERRPSAETPAPSARTGHRRAGLALLGVATAALVSGALPAQAGFLDFIFGGPQLRPRGEIPLEMTVRPEQPVQPRYGTGDEIPHVKVIPIDPVAVPDWYLVDPTLKPGDIVVLPNKVLVYNGRRAQRRLADFDDLDRSRSLSGKTRERVRLLTEYSHGPAGNYTIIPAPEQPQTTAAEPAAGPRGTPARSILINAAADASG